MCCTWLLTCLSLVLCSHFGSTVKLIPEDTNNWWQHEVFYQIYPRSFKDSDGDGIGDLKGITSKLQYLRDTGITATWMSPIFQSPMVDFGYDISDYRQIQPEYGTLEDFDALIAEANRLGIKIILDFVPNHSSDKHEWFAKSVTREPGYEDFYVWEDGKMENGVRSPPNNWVSVFDGSAWQWHETRQQYYLRQFTAGQPDLNYRNPRVVDAMDDILIYWLNRGVAGFRIDAVIYIYEDEQLRDEPLSGTTNDPNSVDYLRHIYTRNQPEDATIIQHWRKLLDDYSEKNTGASRIMMTEGYSDLKTLMNFYEDSNGVQGSHFPFNFYFITDVTRNSDALDYIYFIEKWLTYMPKGHVANWVMGNHDNPRIGSRFGEKAIDAMNMIMMTLPGVGVTYNGEEIGMVDYRNISWEDTVDEPACQAGMDRYQIVSRDPERTPFQWNDDVNAGFSNAVKTWLPVNPNYRTLNLRQQQYADRSHYKVYKSLIALKKSKAVLRDGAFIAEALSSNVLIYKRRLKGHHSIATIVNVSGDQQTVDASNFISLPKVTVLVAGVDSNYTPGGRLKTSDITLAPYEGLVLKL